MKYAVVTGASSGFGLEFAKILSSKYGYNLIVVARREERLLELKNSLKTEVVIAPLDLSIMENCYQLGEIAKKYPVDLLINNAGFGDVNYFLESDLEKELKMIDVNIKALHVLTKLFLKMFDQNNKGLIINVGSVAGFIEGPYMATYYSSKNYVRVLTNSLADELRKKKSKVKLALICPGPVKTEFDQVANVEFVGALSQNRMAVDARYVAEYGLKKAFKGKRVIVPGVKEKFSLRMAKLIPMSWTRNFVSKQQKKKMDK